MNTEPVSPSLKRGRGPLRGRSGRARSAAAGCNWPGAPSAPPLVLWRRARHAPHQHGRLGGVAVATRVHRPGRRARAVGRRLETPRECGPAASPRAGPAPPERSGLSAEDEAWASSSGQVREALEEAAGGNLGRRRPALRSQGRWGRQGTRPTRVRTL